MISETWTHASSWCSELMEECFWIGTIWKSESTFIATRGAGEGQHEYMVLHCLVISKVVRCSASLTVTRGWFMVCKLWRRNRQAEGEDVCVLATAWPQFYRMRNMYTYVKSSIKINLCASKYLLKADRGQSWRASLNTPTIPSSPWSHILLLAASLNTGSLLINVQQVGLRYLG